MIKVSTVTEALNKLKYVKNSAEVRYVIVNIIEHLDSKTLNISFSSELTVLDVLRYCRDNANNVSLNTTISLLIDCLPQDIEFDFAIYD